MITLSELQEIIGDSFFNSDYAIAGMVMFCAVMGFVFMVFGRKSLIVPFALMLPVTLIFTSLSILPESLTILLVIVSVVGLAMVARDKVAS